MQKHICASSEPAKLKRLNRPARQRATRPEVASVDAEGFPSGAAIARRLQEIMLRVFGAPPPFNFKGSSQGGQGRGFHACDAKLATLPTSLPHQNKNEPHP